MGRERPRARAKKNAIEGAFAPRRIDMLASPAWQVLTASSRKLLERIEIEHSAHAGTMNGRLAVTYGDFEGHGVERHSIAPAIRECEALGFIEVTQRGRGGNREFRAPSFFRLTFRHTKGSPGDGTHEWRRIGSVDEARAIRKAARTAGADAANRQRRAVDKKQKTGGYFPQFSVGNLPTEMVGFSVGKSDVFPVGKLPTTFYIYPWGAADQNIAGTDAAKKNPPVSVAPNDPPSAPRTDLDAISSAAPGSSKKSIEVENPGEAPAASSVAKQDGSAGTAPSSSGASAAVRQRSKAQLAGPVGVSGRQRSVLYDHGGELLIERCGMKRLAAHAQIADWLYRVGDPDRLAMLLSEADSENLAGGNFFGVVEQRVAALERAREFGDPLPFDRGKPRAIKGGRRD